MSAIDLMFELLEGNEQLADMLEVNMLNPKKPAIYDSSPPDDAKYPYVVMSYNLSPGELSDAQVDGVIQADIYTAGERSDVTEGIKNEIQRTLYKLRVNRGDNFIQIDPGTSDYTVPDPVPEVVHWLIDFNVKYWRMDLIELLN